MPRINVSLEIDINIQNYSEIAREKGGAIASMLSAIPLAEGFVQSQIDEAIANQLKASLPMQLETGLTNGLRENGVHAEIRVRHC